MKEIDWNDKNTAIEKIKKNPLALRFASSELKNDKEVVMTAVGKFGFGDCVRHASDNLKNDREVVMTAVKNNGLALKLLSDKFKDDKEVVMCSVSSRSGALEFASDRLKDDHEIVITAMENNKSAFEFASDRLKNDPVMKAFFKGNITFDEVQDVIYEENEALSPFIYEPKSLIDEVNNQSINNKKNQNDQVNTKIKSRGI